jgi:glycosyltransferase involved in cell wall biosynthesis
MHAGLRISLVIPCHNEEQGLSTLLPRVPQEVDEIIVVDNNCSDQTAEVARSQGARVVAEPRRGYGRPIRPGLPPAAIWW